MSGSLNHSPAYVIWQLLVDQNLATDPDNESTWPAYINNNSHDVDDLIVVYDTQGRDSGKNQPSSELQEHHGLQFRIRASASQDAFSKANAIQQTLDGLTNESVTISTDTYTVYSINTSPIIRIGKEQPEDRLYLYTLNVTAAIRLNP